MSRRLSDLAPADWATLVGISSPDPAQKRRLEDLGFITGSRVVIIARAGLGGPIAVKTPGGVFALRLAEARDILVM